MCENATVICYTQNKVNMCDFQKHVKIISGLYLAPIVKLQLEII